jgi:hypothetical protein
VRHVLRGVSQTTPLYSASMVKQTMDFVLLDVLQMLLHKQDQPVSVEVLHCRGKIERGKPDELEESLKHFGHPGNSPVATKTQADVLVARVKSALQKPILSMKGNGLSTRGPPPAPSAKKAAAPARKTAATSVAKGLPAKKAAAPAKKHKSVKKHGSRFVDDGEAMEVSQAEAEAEDVGESEPDDAEDLDESDGEEEEEDSEEEDSEEGEEGEEGDSEEGDSEEGEEGEEGDSDESDDQPRKTSKPKKKRAVRLSDEEGEDTDEDEGCEEEDESTDGEVPSEDGRSGAKRKPRLTRVEQRRALVAPLRKKLTAIVDAVSSGGCGGVITGFDATKRTREVLMSLAAFEAGRGEPEEAALRAGLAGLECGLDLALATFAHASIDEERREAGRTAAASSTALLTAMPELTEAETNLKTALNSVGIAKRVLNERMAAVSAAGAAWDEEHRKKQRVGGAD